IYVTGSTVSTDLTTANAYSSSRSGNRDDFVLKLNSSGSSLTYATYLGGSTGDSTEASNAIVVNSSGQAIITGVTSATDFPTTLGAYHTTNSGGLDAFITKLASGGNSLSASSY